LKYWKHGSSALSTPLKTAYKIFGRNFIDLQVAELCFGVHPDARDVAVLEHIPYAPEILEACKDTHALIAFPSFEWYGSHSPFYKKPLYKLVDTTTVEDKRRLDGGNYLRRLHEDHVDAKWLLVKKEPMTGYFVRAPERPLRLIEAIYAAAICKEFNEEYLWKGSAVGCAETLEHGTSDTTFFDFWVHTALEWRNELLHLTVQYKNAPLEGSQLDYAVARV
jgi:hypothetical protein